MRRYFFDAIPKGKEADASNPAVQGVLYCDKLFEYERQSKEKKHTPEQRQKFRQSKEKPLLMAFWAWLEPVQRCSLVRTIRVEDQRCAVGLAHATTTRPLSSSEVASLSYSMLTAIYHVLSSGEIFHDLGADYYNSFNKEKKINSLLSKLKKLGWNPDAVTA